MSAGYTVKNVLVVDDAVVTRDRLCRLLAETEGVEIRACAACKEAVLHAIERSEPACIVIDVPARGAGYELLATLRARCAGCRIVVLTNHAADEFRLRSFEAGVDLFLVKSQDFERVQDYVRALQVQS